MTSPARNRRACSRAFTVASKMGKPQAARDVRTRSRLSNEQTYAMHLQIIVTRDKRRSVD